MSLLSKASLVLTPNAVKESKLYSIIPSNGNGDMTVVRATTATRVNSEGFIEETPYNLVKYSEMFTDNSWTKNISTITANTTIAPNGTLTADTFTVTSVGQSRLIYSNISFNISRYILSIYVKKNNINFNYIELGNTYATFDLSTGQLVNSGNFSTGWNFVSATSQTLSNGWFKLSVVGDCSIAGTYAIRPFQAMSAPTIFVYPTIGDSSYIWGAQLTQGSTIKDYFPTTDRLNVQRLNYDVAGGCPSILLEPQRTNLVTYSEQFDNVAWNKANVTITANTTNSPSNVLNGCTLNEGFSNNTHNINNSIIVQSGVNTSISIYVKKETMTFFRLILNENLTTTGWACAQFNLDTLTYTSGVGATGNFVSASIISVGNGWYRCNLVANLPINGASLFLVSPSNGNSISPADSRGRALYSGIGKTMYVWGAQAEQGAYPTSYIPTVSSTVSRNADVLSRNNIYTNGLITSAGGTWFVELNNNVPAVRGSSAPKISISDSLLSFTGNFFYIKNAVNELSRVSLVIGVNSITTVPYTTLTDNVKIAIKWNSITADIFINGVKVLSSFAFTTTNMEFLNADASTNIYIKSTLLFPTPLTDTECIQLTTL